MRNWPIMRWMEQVKSECLGHPLIRLEPHSRFIFQMFSKQMCLSPNMNGAFHGCDTLNEQTTNVQQQKSYGWSKYIGWMKRCHEWAAHNTHYTNCTSASLYSHYSRRQHATFIHLASDILLYTWFYVLLLATLQHTIVR